MRPQRNRFSANNRGLSLVELIVTLVVLAILLSFLAPVSLTWYRTQQFLEDANRLVNGLRQVQYRAMTGGRWHMAVVHKGCPVGGSGQEACLQVLRLAAGSCGVTGGWPAWGNIPPCVNAAEPGPGTVCEYVANRWVMPAVPEVGTALAGGGNFTAYVFSPDGFVGIQVNPNVTVGECLGMTGPNVFLVTGQAPLANLQVILSYTRTSPRYYKGVCVWGAGRIATTPGRAPTAAGLGCV